MSLEGLGIGGIKGILDFGGFKPNKLLDKSSSNTLKNSGPIESTSTPRNDAIQTQNMTIAPKIGGSVSGFANTSTFLDRQIEDLSKKQVIPKINFNQGFGGIAGITKPTISGINKPVIGSDLNQTKGAENTMLKNWSPETKQNITNQVLNTQALKGIDIDTSLNDLTNDMQNVISEGRSPDISKLKQLYPEFNQVDDNVLVELTNDISNVISEGRTVDINKLKQLYPEFGSLDNIQKSEVEGKNPLLRAAGTIRGGVKGGVKGLFKEGIYEGFGEMIKNDKEILKRKDLNSGEKFAKIVIGEGIGKFIGGLIGDTIMGVVGGAAKGFTTESERNYISQEFGEKAKGLLNVLETNRDYQTVKQEFDKLPEQTQKDIIDLTEYAAGYLDMVGAGELVSPAKGLFKKGLEMGVKQTDNIMAPVVKKLETKFAKKVITEADKKIIQDAPEYADKLIDNMHGFTDSEIRKYKAKYGETPGQTLNNKGLIAGGEETLTSSLDDMVKLQTEKKNGLANIKKTIPIDDDVIKMAEEVADFQKGIATPEQLKLLGGKTEFDDLLIKAKKGELNHTELEKIKSTFEREKALKYDATRSSQEAQRLKNLDSSIRTKQQKRAEEGGFDNIREINKEISKNKAISDLLSKDIDKLSGLGLSDYVLLAGSVLEPNTLALLAAKNISQSTWFKKGLVKVLNKINNRTNIADKVADLKAINKISNETQFNNFLKAGELNLPALPGTKPAIIGNDGLINLGGKPISPSPTVKPGIIEIPKKNSLLPKNKIDIDNSAMSNNSNIQSSKTKVEKPGLSKTIKTSDDYIDYIAKTDGIDKLISDFNKLKPLKENYTDNLKYAVEFSDWNRADSAGWHGKARYIFNKNKGLLPKKAPLHEKINRPVATVKAPEKSFEVKPKTKYREYVHYTNATEPDLISKNPNRLIPNSISLGIPRNTRAGAFGKNRFSLYVDKDAKILNINKKKFYEFGKELDTPLNRGKEIYKYAKNNGYDAVKITDSVHGLGDELAVINPSIIKSQAEFDKLPLNSKVKKASEGLSNLGKTMNERITQPVVRMKAPEEPLIAEARKYKSAEEFVKSEPEITVNINKLKPTEGHTYESTIGQHGYSKSTKPPLVMFDGDGFYIMDGNHRYFQAKESGLKEIKVKLNNFFPIDKKGKAHINKLKQIREEATSKGLKPSNGLAGLGKTDFKKPETTGLPKSEPKSSFGFEKGVEEIASKADSDIIKQYTKKGLTKSEIEAIQNYSISSEKNVNNKLISQGLKKLDNYDGVVYRGDDFDLTKGKKVGDTIKTERLMSTEINKNYYNRYPIKYEIQSTNGKQLGKMNNKEFEVLFDKGTEFEIKSVKYVGGNKIIRLKEKTSGLPKISKNYTRDDIIKYAKDNKSEIINKYKYNENNNINGQLVLNTDDVRPLLGEDIGVQAKINHEGASIITKEMRKELIDSSPKGTKVLILGGGGGSGKGYTLKNVINPKGYGWIEDKTLSKTKNIDEIKGLIDKGFKVDVKYVYSPQDKAWLNTIERYTKKAWEGKQGRTVPLNAFQEAHIGVIENMKKMYNEGIPFDVYYSEGVGKPFKITYSDLQKQINKNKNITKNEAIKILDNFEKKGKKLTDTEKLKFFSIIILAGMGGGLSGLGG